MNRLSHSRLAKGLLAVFALSVVAGSASADIPRVEHSGAIAYRTGGVGLDESKAMKHEARRYPLTLEFIEQAGKRGEYSADEQVTIQGVHNRTMFTATSAGPFMLVNLPDGRYKVTATADGHAQTRTVDLSGKPHDRVAFVWPAREIEPR